MPAICRALNSFYYLLYNQRILQEVQTPPKINIKIIVFITHIQDNRISLIRKRKMHLDNFGLYFDNEKFED